MIRRAMLFAINAFACFAGATLLAQQSEGSLSGVITDARGVLMSGVEVFASLVNDPTVVIPPTITDQGGRFLFLRVPSGVYKITAQLQGFSTASIASVGVSAGFRTPVSVRLGISQGKGPQRSTHDQLALIPIYFATDRNVLYGRAAIFGNERASDGRLRFGRRDVSVPVCHVEGQIERPEFWFSSEDESLHFKIVDGVDFDSSATFFSDLRSALSRAPANDALVFIHGFNNKFEDAIFRTAQLTYDIQFAGIPIAYSWPAGKSGEAIGYSADRADADLTAKHLSDFISSVLADQSINRVHIVAHSMGNYALLRALQLMPAPQRRRVTTVFLAAPDIDLELFRQTAQEFTKVADHTVLYASSRDKALKASRRLQWYRRAGDSTDGIVVTAGVDSVDASDLDTDFIGHAYFANNTSVISDIRQVIRDSTFDPASRGLHRLSNGSDASWLFVRPVLGAEGARIAKECKQR